MSYESLLGALGKRDKHLAGLIEPLIIIDDALSVRSTADDRNGFLIESWFNLSSTCVARDSADYSHRKIYAK
ncbi:hypothetical protein L596_007134 [Steinernema carpocapsae]|uniref:Uncharacterized protein n=1 Tax=Steinernema carpocapsae TaxID=34508 RepID=A0A4U5P916_STECR|nr:hypothetical protein L596_007134 [Steinernema carpocapsae]